MHLGNSTQFFWINVVALALIVALPEAVELVPSVEFVESVLLSEATTGLSLQVAKAELTLGSILCKTTSPGAPVQSGNSTQVLGL